MAVKWKKGKEKKVTYDPDLIADELEKLKKTDPKTGEISFGNVLRVDDCLSLLNDWLDISEEIPDFKKHQIVFEATCLAGKGGKITSHSLLKHIEILKTDYFKIPFSPYIFITSLSLGSSERLKNRRIGKNTITLSHKLPRLFQKERERLKERVPKPLFTEYPQNYQYVRIRVSARSELEAADSAFECLEFLRGIWNFYTNLKFSGHRSIPWTHKPLNKITLGPLHTIHHPSGQLATEDILYNLHYRHPLKPLKIDKTLNPEAFFDFEKKVRRQINKCRYTPFLKDAIIRYSQAFDSYSWNNIFMKLWNVLEFLTKVKDDNGYNYQIAIKRAAFIRTKDRDFYAQILNNLREFRNNSIHNISSDTQIELYVYQLKRCVEALLYFHLWNDQNFKTLSEVINFLDHPTEIEALDTKIEDLNSKLRMAKIVKKALIKNP